MELPKATGSSKTARSVQKSVSRFAAMKFAAQEVRVWAEPEAASWSRWMY
jgi:hypothetical protein